MDSVQQMEMFVRVVETKSLSAAARTLGLSLPAVSRRLRALEEELATNLIARSTRRLRVTEAGREWYAHCVRMLRDIETAKAAVRQRTGVRGSLVVSTSLTFGTSFVLPQLARLRARYPELSVDLRLEDRLVDLVGENVDVALRAGPEPPNSTAFVAHRISMMQRVLVAAPRWLKKHGQVREPEQLVGKECLLQVTLSGEQVRWTLHRGEEQRTLTVRGHLRTNAPLALLSLAVDGLGIAFLPDWIVADDVANGRLKRLLPEWSSAPIPAWAIHRTELRGNPRVNALLELLSKSEPRPTS